MPSILGRMNAIARRGSAYKTARLNNVEIGDAHHPFVHMICNHPGETQESISKMLCLNKSTVARTLCYLEEHGYVTRVANTRDRRELLIYPTEKLLVLLPQERKFSAECNAKLSEGISEDEMQIFNSVLERMYEKAKEIITTIESEDGVE